jgi:hypothetical protein
VIRLHAAGGNQCIGAPGLRVRGHERELAHFVSAEPERNRVISLDQQVRGSRAEAGGEPRHRLDQRRHRYERQRLERRERGA